ncbi:4-aminobutyrate aminotransferase [Aspergillus niger]|uniref:4-aminobutyrate aminotransferase n=1 Tax=Aspergillus niger TaxID=5061 RepID=A0A505IF93_ASPNG|nr:4-aminobutyrate aminotransferase [Aspergillus niger]
MLGWITGQEDQVADNSRAGEPPETPAPVFAIRAFKSALFGTPGADDDDGNTGDAFKASKADLDLAMNAMASPTKSILVTPGTASNRRKTVSFGDGVVDNERKREDPFTKPNKTPTSSSNNFSSQWSATSSDGKFKPRSKLTQALMDSREKSKGTGLFSSQDLEPNPSSEGSRPSPTEDDNDDTINLDEPRSQSGKYWKAEFDNYRTKTTWEIKKLIQYRSAAKTYAKKKDEEASRLADKLREEEIKVSEMERHVTHLASTMVGESANADKEKLVQDLTKQTALALQYKHRVNSLRKLLERHGVVGNEVDDIAEQSESESSSEKTTEELRKTQQALDEAKAKIDDMKLQQSDFTKLQDLARSSEQKACELQKENASLKQTLARVKQEMSKYEGRRKEKEAKLKQREAKLETRIQEYRERLKNASQQHRDHEESLKESFNEERHRMQEQIDQLKIKLTAIESLPHTQVRARHSESPRKNYTGKSNNTNTYRSLYAPTNTTMTSLAHHLANNLDDSHHGRLRARRSPSKYSLDAVTALPDSHVLDRAKRRQSLAAVVPRDSIPMDRKLQAQARLKQRKEETRKGKENMRTYTNQPLSVLEPIS